MEIVYCTNKNYERYTKLSIDTLLKFNPTANITILTNEKLDLPYAQVRPVYPENFHFDGVNQKITKESYFRLFIADTLKHLDKCIYLDSDTLVCGDITPFWNLEPKTIAASHDPIITNELLANRGIENAETYFNAGVLCMNLKGIRESRLPQRANFITQKKTKIKHWLHDQTILNIIYGEETLVASYAYNTFVRTYVDDFHDVAAAVKSAKVLHLLGSKNEPRRKESVFSGIKQVHDYIMEGRGDELKINFFKCLPNAERGEV